MVPLQVTGGSSSWSDLPWPATSCLPGARHASQICCVFFCSLSQETAARLAWGISEVLNASAPRDLPDLPPDPPLPVSLSRGD